MLLGDGITAIDARSLIPCKSLDLSGVCFWGVVRELLSEWQAHT